MRDEVMLKKAYSKDNFKLEISFEKAYFTKIIQVKDSQLLDFGTCVV